jgi:D-alanine-D-alanine ligase
LKRKRVAVLAGGWSPERPISLVTGGQVWKSLRGAGFTVLGLDLVADPGSGLPSAGTSPDWTRRVPLSQLLPRLKAWKAEAAFLCLHGPGGEDGCIQGLLELAGIPYTGSGVQASSLAMDKDMSKRIFSHEGLPTPAWELCGQGGHLPSLKLPFVVKPVDQGSSVGVSVVQRASQFGSALRKARAFGRVMAEVYVKGRELTVAVLDGLCLPIVEILPQHDFYDWHSKYAEGGSRHLCPATLPKALAQEVRRVSLEAHRVLGCRGYSRVDLMLDGRGKLWILEVNTLPGMTRTSLVPDAARAAGMSFEHLLERILKAA